jgi:hypothetical protein
MFSQGTPLTDLDYDGMPDDWEKAHGLNPQDPNDGKNDQDNDGYTNVEEYLNDLIPMKSNSALLPPNNLRFYNH